MTDEERVRVMTEVDQAKRVLPRLSREQVKAMLDKLPMDARGRVQFHELQLYVGGGWEHGCMEQTLGGRVPMG